MRTDLVKRVANIVEMAWIRQKEYLEGRIRNDPTLRESDRTNALQDLRQIKFLHNNRKALRDYLQKDSNRSMTETLDTAFQPFSIDLQQGSGQQLASEEQDNAVTTPNPLPVSAPSIVVQQQSPRAFIRSDTNSSRGANKPMRTRSQTADFSSATRVTSDVAQAYLGSPIINASHLSWLFARFNAYGVTNEMVMSVIEALPNPVNTLEYRVEEGRVLNQKSHLMMYHQVLQAVDNNTVSLKNKLLGSRDILSDTQAWLGEKVSGFILLPKSSKAFIALLAVDYASECKDYKIENKVDPSKRSRVLGQYRGNEKKRVIRKLQQQKKVIARRVNLRRIRRHDRERATRAMVRAATRVLASRAVKKTALGRESTVSLRPFLMIR